MINKVLNNALNSMSQILAENKDKVISAAKKRGQEELNSQIPSPADLENQLRALQTNSDVQSGLLKAEKLYNKFISLIDKAIKKLEDSKRELTQIETKLNTILSKLNFLEGFTDILTPIFNILKGVLGAVDGALAASSSTLANGLVINKLGEKKKDLKDLVKKGEGSLKSIPDVSKYFREETKILLDPLNKGIKGLDDNIQKLKDLRAQIVAIYESFIGSLIIPQLNDADNNNETLGNENLSDYIKDENNLSTIISDAVGVGGGNNPNDTLEEAITQLAFKRFKQ
jgi:hypothetical protein